MTNLTFFHRTFILPACVLLLLAGAAALPLFAADAQKLDESGWVLPDANLGSGWHVRIKDACAQAAKENKPILILFTGPDWSSSCKRMESSIIRSKEFASTVLPSVVGLYVRHFVDGAAPDEQIDANHSLRKSLNAPPVYPCTILIASDGKKILGTLPGLPEKKAYLQWIVEQTGIETAK